MSWNEHDLKLLVKYAAGRKFIIETGGGISTIKLSKVARKYKSIMVSIEVDTNRTKCIKGVDHQIGWSIEYDDIIKKEDPQFKEAEARYYYKDRDVVYLGQDYMVGERDLIRKSIKKYGSSPDFFFCDTGEYCGLSEWNIVKGIIPINGIFACHDIYYPKSVKCFQVAKEISLSEQWKILKQTKSRQGLLIAKKVKEYAKDAET